MRIWFGIVLPVAKYFFRYSSDPYCLIIWIITFCCPKYQTTNFSLKYIGNKTILDAIGSIKEIWLYLSTQRDVYMFDWEKRDI